MGTRKNKKSNKIFRQIRSKNRPSLNMSQLGGKKTKRKTKKSKRNMRKTRRK